MPGGIAASYTLRAVSTGAGLTVEQAGLPGMIPGGACRPGWQQSFELLARLAAPEIPAHKRLALCSRAGAGV